MKRELVKVKKKYISGERRREIYDQLIYYIESGRIFGITKTALADKFGVSPTIIAKYLKQIYETIPPENIKKTQVDLNVMFRNLFIEVQQLVNSASDSKDKRDSIRLMLETIEKYTSFLESFNLKEKTQDNVSIGLEKQLIIVRDPPESSVIKLNNEISTDSVNEQTE